ncbi:arylesterase [Zeaxanthinibacter enoshimensis]|uniref:arylesterase n=1 Tax=Zeaxanthinibacter enoshimensis TaxID=392009 RepID=UPI003568B235
MNPLVKYFCPIVFFLLCSCGPEPKKEPEKNTEEKTEEMAGGQVTDDRNIILIFGNSLTAGLGVAQEDAYPALLQKMLDSAGYQYTVVNAGLSGDTTASGRSRLDWILKQDIDIFILELGANDGLRGIPLTESRENLINIIRAVREQNQETAILLAGMQLPPNLGPEYTGSFKNMYPEIAEQENVILIPFLLQGVAGNSRLNQEDGIHPTEEGHKIMAKTVWPFLQEAITETQMDPVPDTALP